MPSLTLSACKGIIIASCTLSRRYLHLVLKFLHLLVSHVLSLQHQILILLLLDLLQYLQLTQISFPTHTIAAAAAAVIVAVVDSRFDGREFDSQPPFCQETISGKLFTPTLVAWHSGRTLVCDR